MACGHAVGQTDAGLAKPAEPVCSIRSEDEGECGVDERDKGRLDGARRAGGISDGRCPVYRADADRTGNRE